MDHFKTRVFLLQKSGKWCAVHVRVAWEIYHHQQKQNAESSKNGEGKPPSDALRPPSHLLPPGPPGSSIPRPDLPSGSLLGPGIFLMELVSLSLFLIICLNKTSLLQKG